MNAAELSDRLPPILANMPGIILVYLFGSQVTGQVGPMSDYDLAVYLDSDEDALAVQAHFQYEIVHLVDQAAVDVVVLNQAPIELAYHVIASGRRLYQRDLATRVEYEARVLGLYGDYLPVLQFFREHTLQGDEHGKRVQRYREALGRTQRSLGSPPGSSGSSSS